MRLSSTHPYYTAPALQADGREQTTNKRKTRRGLTGNWNFCIVLRPAWLVALGTSFYQPADKQTTPTSPHTQTASLNGGHLGI